MIIIERTLTLAHSEICSWIFKNYFEMQLEPWQWNAMLPDKDAIQWWAISQYRGAIINIANTTADTARHTKLTINGRTKSIDVEGCCSAYHLMKFFLVVYCVCCVISGYKLFVVLCALNELFVVVLRMLCTHHLFH